MKSLFFMSLRTAMLLCVIAAFLYSCSKKSTPQPTPAPDAHLVAVTSGPWKLSKWEGKHQDGTWRTLIMTTDQTSHHITYNADHTYTNSALYQGSTLSGAGTWKFANNETTIVIIPSGTPDAPDSTTYSAMSTTALQEKEEDWTTPITLSPDITGSATDTLFYGWRFTWTH